VTHRAPPEVAPTEEEMLALVSDAVDELNKIATHLEAYVGARSPVERTRRDDEPHHWSDV
jgi:hypothetical protein